MEMGHGPSLTFLSTPFEKFLMRTHSCVAGGFLLDASCTICVMVIPRYLSWMSIQINPILSQFAVKNPGKSVEGQQLEKLKEKLAYKKGENTITFDIYGNPIGNWANEFKSYIGAVVRVQVDINSESWNSVSEALKELIWEDIKSAWNLKDDVRKKQVLATANKMWRDFKTRLVARLRNGEDPCETYDFITKEQWEKFKMTHESEEFKEKSDRARENQKLNKHPHYLGKGGYAAKRSKWLVDDPIASLSMSESIISDERTRRSYDWVRARVKEKEGGGYYIPTENTREVFEKMGAWQEKVLEGSWSPHGHDDILSRALGNKEHGGRVRGVGGRACIKDVFGSEKSTQSGVVSVDDLATITQQIEAKVTKRVREEYKQEMTEMINLKLRGILDHFKQNGMRLPKETFGFESSTLPKELIRSSCHSVDPDNFSDVETLTPCRLCVMNSDYGRVIVAMGTVFPSICQGTSLVHGEQIASHNVKVSVDDVVAEFQHASLPVPTNEHKRVGDAAGSFVQWPKNLVILGQDPILPEKKKGHKTTSQKVTQKPKQISSKGSTTPIRKKEVLVDDDKLQNLSEKCRYLHDVIVNLSSSLQAIEVVCTSEVFKHNLNKEVSIYVTRGDITEFLRMSWLNVPILDIFTMYIHKLCKDLNIDESFGFMCPSEIALVRENIDPTTTYMTDVLLRSRSKRFILAPYFQDQHWMLLLICCRENVVYLFDSLQKKRTIRIKGLLGVAFRLYVVQGGKRNNNIKLHWYEDEVQSCPQQKGGTECGYYVMRYMYDIIMQFRKDPKTNWKEALGRGSYSQQQIDEIRDVWADYFINDCV